MWSRGTNQWFYSFKYELTKINGKWADLEVYRSEEREEIQLWEMGGTALGSPDVVRGRYRDDWASVFVNWLCLLINWMKTQYVQVRRRHRKCGWPSRKKNPKCMMVEVAALPTLSSALFSQASLHTLEYEYFHTFSWLYLKINYLLQVSLKENIRPFKTLSWKCPQQNLTRSITPYVS